MIPAFRLTLKEPKRTQKTVLKWSCYASEPTHGSEIKYRIMVGRSWLGGKRERGTYYTYTEVMTMWTRAVANTLGIRIEEEPDPENYPLRQKVRISKEVARETHGGLNYDISWIRSAPIPDNKHGGFKARVMGYPKMINLKHLTPVEPEKERWEMVKVEKDK